MYFSGKIVPMVALALATMLAAHSGLSEPAYPGADIGARPIGNDEGQRLIQGVQGIPGFDPKNAWLATGYAEFHETSGCVTSANLYVSFKPDQDSHGIWHGKKYLLVGKAKSQSDKDCKGVALQLQYAWDTASFVNPDSIHPDEHDHGAIPGVFQVYPPVTDENLLTLKDALAQISNCLDKGPSCSYFSELRYLDIAPNTYLPAIKPERLITVGFGYKPTCYNVAFAEEPPSTSSFLLSLCLTEGVVSSVHIDMILRGGK